MDKSDNSLKLNKGRFDYSAYYPSKLIDVAKEYEKVIDGEIKVAMGQPHILIESLSKAIRVKAEFCDEFRPLIKEHKEVVEKWLKSFGYGKYTGIFQSEIKVKEDGIEYWLPIQEQLIPFLQKEIHPNEITEFYIVYYGAYNYDHVFVINEFRKIK